MVYSTRASKLFKYHGSMLADPLRVDAYRRALEKTIRPGDVVLDLGCGTGILAFLAAKLGARKVYAVEVSEVFSSAQDLRLANGLADVEIISKLSYLTSLPERADVLVTETLGDFGLDEGIVGAVLDARARLLTDEARIIPQSIEIFAAPVSSEKNYAHVAAYSSDVCGLDFSALRAHVASLLYQERIDSALLVADPAPIGQVDLRTAQRTELSSTASFVARRDAVVHGVAGWFRATIAEGITLTNSPLEPRTHWSQIMLPLPSPIPVSAGDSLDFGLEVQENGGRWTWRMAKATGSSG